MGAKGAEILEDTHRHTHTQTYTQRHTATQTQTRTHTHRHTHKHKHTLTNTPINTRSLELLDSDPSSTDSPPLLKFVLD